MTQTLLLDLGGVLVGYDYALAFDRLGAYCGKPAEVLASRFWASKVLDDFETGRTDMTEFIRALNDALETDLDLPMVVNSFTAIFSSDPLVPPETIRLLQQRFRLVAVSNTNVIHHSYLRSSFSFFQLFSAEVLSFQVGACKPKPEMFVAALQAANCAAADCIFVDDVRVNVDAALSFGVNAYQFSGGPKLNDFLLALLNR